MTVSKLCQVVSTISDIVIDTVLSFHEHPGYVHDDRDLKSFRANTLSVLCQLSNHGHGNGTVDPISMQTIRKALKEDLLHSSPGVEGSSLLFYYLFDDWQAVYTTVVKYSERLAQFDDAILFDMWKKSYQTPDTEIIPRLHKLGRQGRQLSHLYSGYKNLVSRILDSKAITIFAPHSASQSDLSSMNGHKGVLLAQSASQRFERLKDRLELLIIEQMKESLAERDALVSTVLPLFPSLSPSLTKTSISTSLPKKTQNQPLASHVRQRYSPN
jgi:hypothetical protein